MSAYDGLYRMIAYLYTHGNSFALLDFDRKGNLAGIYPLSPLGMEICTTGAANYSTLTANTICKFSFSNGCVAAFPYSQLIHLRRFYVSGFLGEDNLVLEPVINLAQAENDGITASLQTAGNVRGILKFEQLINQSELKKIKDGFIRDYLSTVNNPAGVIALDGRASYQPLNGQSVILDAEQSAAIRQKIYSYFGIAEKIVNGSCTDDEFLAFYESVIEPLAIQLSSEFTTKLFTATEIEHGNSIIFEGSRMIFASNSVKINMLRELLPLGLLTINEARNVLNLPPVPDGERRLQSLNYIDTEHANEYQMAK